MSKKFREATNFKETPTTKPEMRAFLTRPGRTDDNGNLIYMTEQHHKDECNINNILKKYDQTGLLSHVQTMEAMYGDMTGDDYKTAMDMILTMRDQMDAMPSHIRKRFENSPQKFLEFMENPDNRDEAIKLGIINSAWPADLDGLGEHVKKENQPDPKAKKKGGDTE